MILILKKYFNNIWLQLFIFLEVLKINLYISN